MAWPRHIYSMHDAAISSAKRCRQVAEMTQRLKALLVEHGLETDGKVVLTQYHPKRAPRWMRINEVRAVVPTCSHVRAETRHSAPLISAGARSAQK